MDENIITSRQNPLIQQVRKLQTSRAFRHQTGRFVADGVKLLQEAARWCGGLETVLVTPELGKLDVPPGVRVVRVSKELMAYASQMEAPQGALFICRMPDEKAEPLRAGTLVLDGVQDPGNLGTILRTADALGAPLLALTQGCADLWNPKTVRASMGAVFRLPVVSLTAQDLVSQCRARRLRLLASALSDTAAPIGETNLQNAVMLVGSEGKGVSPELLEAADGHVIIPIRSRCESLNAAAAAAILLWEMGRAGAFASGAQYAGSN